MITQLDTENADRDLTSLVTVLTDTPDASNPMICQGLVLFGDGAKDLDGTGGTFELVITVGGQTVQPSPQEVEFGTEVRSSVWTTPFPVPANMEVIMRVKSPNAGDNDVDVTAYLYDISAHPSLVQNHLDHLLAADYDPSSKPGVATALLNEIVENDGGVSRFTENALEQGPDTTTGLALHGDYDAAKTAASSTDVTTAHSTTDGKIDAVQDAVTTIAEDVENIDGDAMRGTDGANTTVPDAAGTAAALHAITDALEPHGTAMRGTDGANTTVPDAAGTAAGLHTTTDSKIDGLNNFDPANDEVDIGKVKGVAVSGVNDFKATGFSTHAAADVWSVATRSLTTFGTLVSDIATAVWAAAARTLTAFGFTPSLHSDYDAAKTAASSTDVTTAHSTTDGKIDAVQDDVTTIAGDVENIDGDAMRGTDSAATAAEVVTALFANASMKEVLAFARGKVVIDGNDVKFYDTDDTTLLYTMTLSASGRTIS